MPGDSVTVWILCEHGRAGDHSFILGKPDELSLGDCPGGRSPTDEELIEELAGRGFYITADDSEEPPKDPWDYDP